MERLRDLKRGHGGRRDGSGTRGARMKTGRIGDWKKKNSWKTINKENHKHVPHMEKEKNCPNEARETPKGRRETLFYVGLSQGKGVSL